MRAPHNDMSSTVVDMEIWSNDAGPAPSLSVACRARVDRMRTHGCKASALGHLTSDRISMFTTTLVHRGSHTVQTYLHSAIQF